MAKKKSKSKAKSSKNRAVNKKIKILGYCDSPTCATGFGTVSRNIFEGLYRTGKYDIDILGINYWGDPHNFPYRIWPTGTNSQKDPYGRQKVLNMIPQMDFDILFFLQDSFILNFIPTLIPHLKNNRSKPFKSILYYPVDSIIKQEWADNIDPADYLVAYSEFGKQETLKRLDRDIEVIPHGVNTAEFYPIAKDEIMGFRKQYFGAVADHFIITNVNRNQQRKDLPRTIIAFKEFKKAVPNSVLYLHCAMKDQGWDLPEVCKSFGLDITQDVIFPKNFGPNQGYPREVLNMLYNASDVVISTTLGEGFGLCLSPDTNVYTYKGVKKMSELTITDKVLSSNGEYNDVEAIMSREYDNELYEITTWLSNIPIKASAEHGFLVYDNDGFVWKQASDLEINDKLLFPRNYACETNPTVDVLKIIYPFLNKRQKNNVVVKNKEICIQSNFKQKENFIPSYIKIDEDFCKLMGLYLAEGSLSSSKMDSITFSFNKEEKEAIDFVKNQMKKIFGLDFYELINSRPDYNGYSIRFYSSVAAYLFYALCGKGARTKKVSPILLNLDISKLVKLVEGMYIGDGSYSESLYEISFSTTSKDIAYNLRLILARLGILSSVRTSRVEYKVNVSGTSRENLQKLFNLDIIKVDRLRAHERASLNNDYLVLPIKDIVKTNYKGKLVDIQVANTNDFVAENVIVHNSWLEALATKTPIIMPSNTMLPEFITEDIGWLANSGSNSSLWTVIQFDNEVPRPLTDTEDLVDKLLEIYNNPDEAVSRAENGYKWVTTQMDWQKHIAKMWIKLFDKAYKDMMNEIKYNEGNAKSIVSALGPKSIKTEVF